MTIHVVKQEIRNEGYKYYSKIAMKGAFFFFNEKANRSCWENPTVT